MSIATLRVYAELHDFLPRGRRQIEDGDRIAVYPIDEGIRSRVNPLAREDMETRHGRLA